MSMLLKISGVLSDNIYKIEKVLALFIIGIMFVSLTSGVLYRYVFNSPLDWANEMALFMLAWVTFIGGSMALKRQESAAVTIVMDLIQQTRLYKVFFGICYVLVLAFCVFILILSLQWITSASIGLQRSSGMEIPMLYPYLCIPVGFLFMTIHSLNIFLHSFSSRPKGEQ